MRNYNRWAAFAGAVMLAVTGVTPAWADEANQGMTLDTAVVVPTFPESADSQADALPPVQNQQTEIAAPADPAPQAQPSDPNQAPAEGAGGTGQAGVPQPEASDQGSTPQPSGSSTRVIRTGGDSSGQSAQGSAQGGAGGTDAGTGAADYSKGPGFAPQPAEPTQPSDPAQLIQGQVTADNIQIFDVANPVVKTVEKYSYDQMVYDITVLQQQYGSKMQVNGIGTSLDGRTLYDCIIGNPAAPKHILIQGGIHAREYLNPMLIMQQMEMILANYDTGSFHGVPLSSMFNQIAVHFVPMTNPDGITISQFGPDGLRSQELKDAVSTCYVMDTAAGRTSADPAGYFGIWKANARGVDLNLNFDALWQDVYSTAFPSYSGYKGTAPGSEPESQALINLYLSQYPWKAVIHYHSMGEVIYWDIHGNKVQPQSAELANLMSAVTGGYRILPSGGGGGYKDWIQLSANPVPSVTLETGKRSCPMPLSEYPEIWNDNRLTWAYAMEWVSAR